jgi:hypothetical protein
MAQRVWAMHWDMIYRIQNVALSAAAAAAAGRGAHHTRSSFLWFKVLLQK